MTNLISETNQVKSERGQVVGVVRSGVFRKDNLYGSRHMMRKPLGWALDLESLSQAKKLGADVVQLSDRETGHIYKAPIILIEQKGIRLNRGYGIQVCLPLGFWEVDGRNPQRAPVDANGSSPTQLSLFADDE